MALKMALPVNLNGASAPQQREISRGSAWSELLYTGGVRMNYIGNRA
jgi:hypothetical protein